MRQAEVPVATNWYCFQIFLPPHSVLTKWHGVVPLSLDIDRYEGEEVNFYVAKLKFKELVVLPKELVVVSLRFFQNSN